MTTPSDPEKPDRPSDAPPQPMTKVEALALLRPGMAELEVRTAVIAFLARATGGLQKSDLRNADLRDVDLSYMNLSSADLRNADLSGADLQSANLSHADMSGANLINTRLGDAILNQTQLGQATLGLTTFDVDLSSVLGLESAVHGFPSPVTDRALRSVPPDCQVPFLRGVGFDDPTIEFFRAHHGIPIQFYSAFISYSTEDALFAENLHDKLQGKGIRCWMDKHEILPGDDLHDSINDAIRLYDKVLLCASKNSLESWWVDREVGRATKKEERLWKERGKKVLSIVPLNLDGYMFDEAWTRGYADDLRSRNAADFVGWENDARKFDGQLDRVVAALRADENARRPPPEPKL